MNSTESIKKGLQLSKSLLVSTIITGEPYTGKLTLVRSIYPQSLYIDAKDKEELKNALKTESEIIIYNFEAIVNLDNYDFQNRRIIAIANKDLIGVEKHFAFIYKMPPLRERVEEVEEVIEKLSRQIQDDLLLKEPLDIDIKALDLTQNYKSLKISLYKEIIKRSLTQKDIEEILYEFFLDNLEGKNGYKEYLSMYEKPLIEAGLKKYKSQLQLADILGLNRNTLRKKINEHDIN